MSTDSFINALRRFQSIRGWTRSIVCDNGTNFIGAKAELDKSYDQLDQSKIAVYLANTKCEWKIIPVQASHFGAVYERKIGSARRILDAMFRELGLRQFSDETLTTFLAEVSGVMNSTPLAEISTDPNDPMPLSPAMILTQKGYSHPPVVGSFEPPDVYCRKRWRQVQYLAEQFWNRWKREYLTTLQTRKKWSSVTPGLQPDDIVLVKDKVASRNFWKMARVVNSQTPGTRTTIATAGYTMERATSDLVFLVRPVV